MAAQPIVTGLGEERLVVASEAFTGTLEKRAVQWTTVVRRIERLLGSFDT